MLKRFAAHFALIFFFALTQLGVATHEISHFSESAKHSQQDKNLPAEQCGQCISYAQVASGLQSTAFVLPNVEASFANTSRYYFNAQTALLTSYAARAPPQINSL